MSFVHSMNTIHFINMNKLRPTKRLTFYLNISNHRGSSSAKMTFSNKPTCCTVQCSAAITNKIVNEALVREE